MSCNVGLGVKLKPKSHFLSLELQMSCKAGLSYLNIFPENSTFEVMSCKGAANMI